MKQFFTLVIINFQILASYSQDLAFERLHFDNEFSVTGPEKASYVGYTKRIANSFVATLFTNPSTQIARLSFSDRKLSQKHGAFVAFNAKGEVMLESHFKNNQLNGKWQSWYHNRFVCDSGKLSDNLPDGVWKTWYEDGQLRSIRTYNAYKFHSLHNEIKCNSRVSFFAITGMVKKNRNALDYHTSAAHSYRTLAGGRHYNTNTKLSFKEIADINTSVENEEYLPPFSKCLHDGLYMNFYPNGAVKDSGFYRDGLRSGVWHEWMEDANTLAVGFYNHGHKKGTWKYYNAAGRLLFIQHYNREGKVIGGKEMVNGK